MPLIYVNYPASTLSPTVRDALAEALTDIALECEKLPASPFMKSTVWVYFNDLPSDRIYHGGKPGGTKVISLEVNSFEGGHDETSKQLLFERFTQAIRKYAEIPPETIAPVYIILRDVPETNWGVFGGTITLDDLRDPDPNAKPI